MKQACQMGFNCPYFRIGEEGDEICIYPYIRITEQEECETFGFPDEGECPLLKWKSELYEVMLAYQESDKVKEAVKEEIKRLNEETSELIRKVTKDLCE